jgi:hypothetical protein
MKWTKGPWKYEADYVFGPHMEMIAEVRGAGDGLPQETNGKILALAPEMYEALRLARLLIEINLSLNHPTYIYICAVLAKADLAKEGEEK